MIGSFVVAFAAGLFFLFNGTTLTWKTYSSDKVPLAFLLPGPWPISHCYSGGQLESFNIKEEFTFVADCYSMQKGTNGSISVTDTGQVDNPVEYLKSEFSFLGVSGDYETKTIGGITGYTLSGAASNEGRERYYVFANDYLYEINLKSDGVFSELVKNLILSTFVF